MGSVRRLSRARTRNGDGLIFGAHSNTYIFVAVSFQWYALFDFHISRTGNVPVEYYWFIGEAQ